MTSRPIVGLAVDGSFLGAKGSGEYRGVDIATGEEVFRHSFSKTTNNLQEFFGVVHALKYNKENGKKYNRIYSDSAVAIVWAENWEVTSALVKDNTTVKTWEHVANCLRWLSNNTKKYNVGIEKWVTADWGENPADFGYKRKNEVNISPIEKMPVSEDVMKEIILKSELVSWIESEEKQPLVDITTLARLKRDFKL